MTASIERDMTGTLDDFVRAARFAFPDVTPQRSGEVLHWKVGAGEAALDIAIVPGPPRTIALLRLPTLRVRFELPHDNPPSRALLARLELALQRGGG